MPENTIPFMFLNIAKDELETLIQYQGMLQSDNVDDQAREIVHEIMGDELNHALIALISAAHALDIKIATDDIEPDPNEIEVE